MTRTCVAQVVCLACAHHIPCVILMRSCVCSDSLRLLHFPLFAHHLFSYHPVLLPAHQLHLPGCGGQIPCAHISEATERDIQKSSVENGSPNDLEYDGLEYDDVTIGKALSSPLFTQEREDDASRRQACHSQDEGLSSSLSSSVSHDITVRPVVKTFDSQIPNVREHPLKKVCCQVSRCLSVM